MSKCTSGLDFLFSPHLTISEQPGHRPLINRQIALQAELDKTIEIEAGGRPETVNRQIPVVPRANILGSARSVSL